MPLPVDIDATYPDDAIDTSVQLHQQYHDVIHEAVNALNEAFDLAVGAGYTGTKREWLDLIYTANGYATLDAGGKVPISQLPDISLTSVSVVADIGVRDTLTVEEGDVAVVTDAGGGLSRSYIYDGTAWQELQSPTDAVASVDGRTGAVTLADLYATAAQGSLADSAVQPGALATVATTGLYADLVDPPTLATVATTGSYNDLVDVPAAATVVHLTAPDSTVYAVQVDNAGVLSTTVVP